MKKFEVTVPVSCLVTVKVLAENEQDAIETALEIFNEDEVEVFDDLFNFQAHSELFVRYFDDAFLSVKAEAYG